MAAMIEKEGVRPMAYSIADAAKAIGVSRSWLYQHIKAGTGPVIVEIGMRKPHASGVERSRRTLIRVPDLDAWLKSMSSPPMVPS